GAAGMLIPLGPTLVAITLLPVVLAKVGERMDWPHRRTDDRASKAWTRWAEAVVRRRWLAAGVALAVVVALVGAATQLQLGDADADSIAKQGDAKTGLTQLESSGIGSGVLLPHEVLIDGASNPNQVAAEMRSIDGIHGAVAPDNNDWRRAGTALVDVFPTDASASSAGRDTLDRVRAKAEAIGSDVRVGG